MGTYVSRPGFAGARVLSPMTPLKGFGVLLDIKNMEYTAVDDLDRSGGEGEEADTQGAVVSGDGTDADGSVDDGPAFEKGEAVAGIVFDTLQARAQVPTSDLLVLREVLLEGASSAPSDLKVSICVTYAYAHSLHSI